MFFLHSFIKDESRRNVLILSIVLVYILFASKFLAIFYYDSVILFPIGYSLAYKKYITRFPKIFIIPISLYLLVLVRFNYSYGGFLW